MPEYFIDFPGEVVTELREEAAEEGFDEWTDYLVHIIEHRHETPDRDENRELIADPRTTRRSDSATPSVASIEDVDVADDLRERIADALEGTRHAGAGNTDERIDALVTAYKLLRAAGELERDELVDTVYPLRDCGLARSSWQSRLLPRLGDLEDVAAPAPGAKKYRFVG